MKAISTPIAPSPGGHYAQAIVLGDVVYVSGQLPIDPQTGNVCDGDIEAQTRQVLRNLSAILKAANSGINQVVKTTVYVSDISLWGQVNEVYAAFFGMHRPARAVVPTRELHHGCLVEIEAIAVLKS